MNLRQLLPLGPLKVSTCLPLGSNANTRQRVGPESDTVKGHRHTLHLAEAWAQARLPLGQKESSRAEGHRYLLSDWPQFGVPSLLANIC